jgi:hypothetical protein
MSDEDHHHHRRFHSHAPTDFGKAFTIGVTLNAGFVALEIISRLQGRLEHPVGISTHGRRRRALRGRGRRWHHHSLHGLA